MGAAMATTNPEIDLRELEDLTFREIDGFSVPPADLIAYNELRSCADLFRMFRERQLEISPQFQREIVWPAPVQTRFIDSLVKQLPIPTMCFSLDYKSQKWQVIDGLQRMWSIIRFLRGDNWRLSRLEDVDPAISGQWVPSFLEDFDLQRYYSRVQNLSLPITVIRCDYSKATIWTIYSPFSTASTPVGSNSITKRYGTVSIRARSTIFCGI
jgi:hypothetical protein